MQAIATLAHLTPTQLEAAERRRKFRTAIKLKAADLADRKIVASLTAIAAAATEAPLASKPTEAVVTVEGWVERQKVKFSEPWFRIEAEINHHVTIRQIQIACADYYGVSIADMHSARRDAAIVRPRQVAYYLCKTLTLRSLPEIGRHFGGRDHTTALWGIQKITRLRKTDENLNATVKEIASKLGVAIA